MGMSGGEKKILSVTSACHSVNHLFFKWLGPLLPFIIPAFNLTYTQGRKIGIYLLFNLWYINFASGHWADRYGRRRMIFSFLLISSMAALLMAISHSFWLLLLLCGLAGVGGGLYHALAVGFISMINPKGGDVQTQNGDSKMANSRWDFSFNQ
jgi:MFS family permease